MQVYAKPPSELVKALQDAIGFERVDDRDLTQQVYSVGCGTHQLFSRRPSVVVLPSTVEQVKKVIEVANTYKFPILPRGGPGFTSSIALKPAIIMDLSWLDKIIKEDWDSGVVVAEGGCSFFKMLKRAWDHGYFTTLADFSPGGIIGAAIVNNGHGGYITEFGRFGDLAEGLEVITGTGETYRLGSLASMDKECGPYHRYVIGPDLVGLFVQSGGSLGIITKVALRFFKYSSAHRYSGWGFRRADINNVAECGRELVLRRIVSDLHLNDWWAVYGWLPGASSISKENWFFFNAILSGESEEEVDAKQKVMASIMKRYGGTEYPEMAKAPLYGPPGWDFMSPIECAPCAKTIRENGVWLYMSLIVPIAMWPKAYAIDEALKIKYGLWNDKYAPHLDSFFGILHRPTVKYETFVYGNPYDPEDKARVNGWIHEFADAMADMGISWHHEDYGPWLGPAWEKFLGNMGETASLFKDLKRVFDPNGILGNPGIFDPREARRLGAESE